MSNPAGGEKTTALLPYNPASPHTVLIVEDHADIRQALKEVLELEGYRIVTAENGQIGLERLREIQGPCVVLLDYRMPVLDGRGFLTVLRADPVYRSTPVIVLSAHADAETVEGADVFLRKPPDLDRLIDCVASFCARGA